MLKIIMEDAVNMTPEQLMFYAYYYAMRKDPDLSDEYIFKKYKEETGLEKTLICLRKRIERLHKSLRNGSRA